MTMEAVPQTEGRPAGRRRATPAEAVRELPPLLPGDKGLPLLGRAFDYAKDPDALMRHQWETYGPVSPFNALNEMLVMVLGPDAIAVVFANKDRAFKMLRAKLYELEMQKRREASQALEDTKSDIGWGHQIRSYVLDQSRIKDLRTGIEESNCDAVLDGDLDEFIEASLKQGL